MSNQFSKDAGNPGEQNGYDHSSRPGEDHAAIPTMLKRAQVEEILQLSRSAIYARMDKNSDAFDASFPTPVRYGGGKSVFWIAAEVYAWLDAQIRQTRGLRNGPRSHKAGGAA